MNVSKSVISINPPASNSISFPIRNATPSRLDDKPVTGIYQKIIKTIIWTNILWETFKYFRSPIQALQKAKSLRKMRDKYRFHGILTRYKRVGSHYYFNYNAPAWPSKAFNRYIQHLLKKDITSPPVSLHTLVFAITKKCGFKCEHCCEWNNLNKPDVLSREDLFRIVMNFYKFGISQIQLSGGEPLNRFDDIIFLLDQSPSDIKYWVYTSGYQLTDQKARILKQHGLAGVTVSLDDYDADRHDQFRGKKGAYQRAIAATRYATANGLAVTFSICATKSFITTENLMRYAELAKTEGASFIQILEPKAVGHYAGKDVLLQQEHFVILEAFYQKLNFEKAFSAYPIVTYHGLYSRRMGCAGSGDDYLYVDTDGDVHNCPFCQRKLFSGLGGDLRGNIEKMKLQGCRIYSSSIIEN